MPKSEVNMRAPTKAQIAGGKRKPKPGASRSARTGAWSEYDIARDAAWAKVVAKNAVVVAEGGVLAHDDPVWAEATAAVAAAKRGTNAGFA